MFEKRWPAVPPQLFTADGGAQGQVNVSDTAGFKVKAQVVISATSLPNITAQVKCVLSRTKLIVGSIGNNIYDRSIDLSSYTVAAGAFIYQDEQAKNTISPADIVQAVYEQEPTVANRSVLVDKYGNFLDSTVDVNGVNRMAVDAEVTVNTVQLFTKPYDAIVASYPSSTVENYQSYVGGISGTPVQLVVVTYTDSTKNFIENVVRTG